MECNRFGRCTHLEYPRVSPEEWSRKGFRPEIPLAYHSGKYALDFASCRSTWVTASGREDVVLNIAGSGYRCLISYLPQHTLERGGEGSYTCLIPFSVGPRVVKSLDLMHELPKHGLPQFCRPDHGMADALMLVYREYRDVASSVDVQCAAVQRDGDGGESLTFRLNSFAAGMAHEAMKNNGPLIARVCFGAAARNQDQPAVVEDGPDGVTRFRVRMSSNPLEARRQRKCIAEAFALEPSCR